MVHGDMLCAAFGREGGDGVSGGGEDADDGCKGDDGDEECEYLAGLVAWAWLVCWSAVAKWRRRGVTLGDSTA